MTTKKKKSARRPRRRTTYETTLDAASTRLDKAVEERTDALMKIDALNREIPYLENLVKALTPRSEPKISRGTTPETQPGYPAQSDMPPQPTGTMDQEEFLQRFMPRAGRVTSTAPPAPVRPQPDGTNPDPDEFLSDDGPGREILS